MIVRTLASITQSDRDVDTPNWNSRRLLLARDGTPFSLHDTLIRAGTETSMWYEHHLEAVYCVEGRGQVEVTDTGERFQIGDGTLYALDGHEKHVLRAETDMRMICVFSPALTGRETHDERGAYPLLATEASNDLKEATS